jgi:rod shape-determining protein MreC
MSFDAGDGSGVRLLRIWANWVVSPPERALQTSKTGVGSIWSNYFDLLHVRQENKDLQATVDRLRLEQAQLLEDARQGQRLEAAQGFQQKYLYATIVAQVVGTSGTDQSRVIYINKGKADGVARDMAVITADGIVGKVREVFDHTAQILCINDQSSGAGVILESNRIRGILRGNAFGQPQIVNILADQRIKPGERVLTAGGDQIFPRGLPVGVVQKVENDPDRDGFIEVVIKPDAHLDSLDEVLVITSTQPRFSDSQMKDLAMSQELKSAEAAAIADQQKASQIMAERLPGLTDPNAPPANPNGAGTGAGTGANGAAQPGGATASGGVTVVPKILPPQHPDRFTPGGATGGGAASGGPPKPAAPAGGQSTPGATSVPKPALPKKPASQPNQNSQPQEKQ